MAHISNLPRSEATRRLDELSELARTEGIIVVDRAMFRGDPNPQSLLGSGRVKDLVVRSLAVGADMILFDQELTPSQARWVGAITDMPILDRTQLILRIFGRRAHSADGKLRVELARLKYALPRLGLKDDALSRIRGGIGMKGPGETSMEISRRRIKDKIIGIQDDLERLGHGREQRRRQRKKSGTPQIAVIGYTNAGKSTLLNALTGSDALVEDKLFATLDPMSRRIRRPRKLDVILSDTVGFITDLPDDLLAAFRSTLEELRDADLLIHLVDVSAPDLENAMKAVQNLLERIELDKIPRKVVLNKIDMAAPDLVENIAARYEAIPISATTGEGLNRLLDEVEAGLNIPKKGYGYDEIFEEDDTI
jgi:GTP-binding protein HflX